MPTSARNLLRALLRPNQTGSDKYSLGFRSEVSGLKLRGLPDLQAFLFWTALLWASISGFRHRLQGKDHRKPEMLKLQARREGNEPKPKHLNRDRYSIRCLTPIYIQPVSYIFFVHLIVHSSNSVYSLFLKRP